MYIFNQWVLSVGYQLIYSHFFRKCECIKFKFRLHPSTLHYVTSCNLKKSENSCQVDV